MTDRKLFITIGVFVAVGAGLMGLVAYPAFNAVKMVSAQITAEKVRAASLRNQDRELARFKEKYETYKPNLEAVAHAFVNAENPIDVIRFMEESAAKAGVKVDIAIVAAGGKAVSTAPQILFDVNSEGSFLATGTFSETLEHGPYLFTVKKVSIEKVSLGEGGDFDGKEKPMPSLNTFKARFLLSVVTDNALVVK